MSDDSGIPLSRRQRLTRFARRWLIPSENTRRWFFVLTASVMTGMLLIAVCPGRLRWIFAFPWGAITLLLIPVAMAVGAASVAGEILERKSSKRWWTAWSAAVFALAITALSLDLPVRLAFHFWGRGFDALLSRNRTELIGTVDFSKPISVGPWRILKVRADERGGVYFVVCEVPDFVDTYFFGFVHEPNSEGSPWGRADYSTTRLSGGWHLFQANNDW